MDTLTDALGADDDLLGIFPRAHHRGGRPTRSAYAAQSSDTFRGDLDRLHAFNRRLGFIANTRSGEFGAPRESMVRVGPNTTEAALIARRTSLLDDA